MELSAPIPNCAFSERISKRSFIRRSRSSEKPLTPILLMERREVTDLQLSSHCFSHPYSHLHPHPIPTHPICWGCQQCCGWAGGLLGSQPLQRTQAAHMVFSALPLPRVTTRPSQPNCSSPLLPGMEPYPRITQTPFILIPATGTGGF